MDITGGSICVSALVRSYLESDMLAGRADNVMDCYGDLTICVHETCAAESKRIPGALVPVLPHPYAAVAYIAAIYPVVQGEQLG